MESLTCKQPWADMARDQSIRVCLVTDSHWQDLKAVMTENHRSDTWMRHTTQDVVLHAMELNTASRILQDNGNGDEGLLLLAYVGEQPAGYLMAECVGTFRQPHVVNFHMFVSADHRGRHVGTVLLQDFLDWCLRQPRILKLELCVMEANVSARALYEKFGFKVEGNRIATAVKDGELHNLIEMGMLLEKEIDKRIFQPFEVTYAK